MGSANCSHRPIVSKHLLLLDIWHGSANISSARRFYQWLQEGKRRFHVSVEKYWSLPTNQLIIYFHIYIYKHYLLAEPGTQMTSIFEGQPPKTRPKFQPKQGAPFRFQVNTIYYSWIYMNDSMIPKHHHHPKKSPSQTSRCRLRRAPAARPRDQGRNQHAERHLRNGEAPKRTERTRLLWLDIRKKNYLENKLLLISINLKPLKTAIQVPKKMVHYVF